MSDRGRPSDEEHTAPAWAGLLTGRELQGVEQVARQWADPRLSSARVRALTEAALAAAAASFQDSDEADFLVHAMTVLRLRLRHASRSVDGPPGRRSTAT